MMKVQSGWSWSRLAGQSSVKGPSTAAATASAFLSPVASRTMARASRMVPMPADKAQRGTSAGSEKNRPSLLASIVSWERLTRRVRESTGLPGSLKAMWPLPPMPRSHRSTPPADRILSSKDRHSRSGNRARPLRTWVFHGRTSTCRKRRSSMKRR